MAEKPYPFSIGEEIHSPEDELSFPVRFGSELRVVSRPVELLFGADVTMEAHPVVLSSQLTYEKLVKYCQTWKVWRENGVLWPVSPYKKIVIEVFSAVGLPKQKDVPLTVKNDTRRIR